MASLSLGPVIGRGPLRANKLLASQLYSGNIGLSNTITVVIKFPDDGEMNAFNRLHQRAMLIRSPVKSLTHAPGLHRRSLGGSSV
jgi:hypothetical protein